jgi:hypothetical protein
MRAKVALTIGLVALLAGMPLSGCGEAEGEEALQAVEGQPLHLGELIYNVAITRFLNADEVSDVEYLAGQPPEPPGESYLGVFIIITNENEDEAVESAGAYRMTDASGRIFEPLESESLYALEIGAAVEADGMIPVPDTTAAEGPVQGSLLIFLVPDDVSGERPLELEIESDAGTGVVELDI